LIGEEKESMIYDLSVEIEKEMLLVGATAIEDRL